MNRHVVLSLACAAAFLAPVSPAQVKLKLLANVDLSSTADMLNPQFIGTNAARIAWDGSDLWVAGFNNGIAAMSTAIVRVSNVFSATPTFGTPFGLMPNTSPNGRGYTGLALRRIGARMLLAATWDNGAADPNGLQMFDAVTGSRLWSKSLRGGTGPAFDPGFPGGNPALGSGIAWTTFGSGRRALQEQVVGTDIWDLSNGMIWNTGFTSNQFPRDIAFDPLGNIYVRLSNDVIKAQRTGDNATLNDRGIELVDTGRSGAFKVLQTVEWFKGLVIYNDRPATPYALPIEDPNQPGAPYTIKVIRASDGVEVDVDWDSAFDDPANPGSLLTGDGIYDFCYDAGTNTLAVLDFFHRSASIFAVEVTPVGVTNCPGSGGQPLTMSVSGNLTGGQTMDFRVSGAQPNAPTQVLLGLTTASVPLPTTPCTIWIGNIVAGFPVAFADGAGSTTTSWILPPFTPPVAFTAQAVAVDAGVTSSLKIVLSNGLAIDLR